MTRVPQMLLLAGSAAAYSCAFPPLGWVPLAPLSVAVLMVLLRGQTPRGACFFGLAWGMVAFGVGLSWLWLLFGPLAVLLWAGLAFFPAVFGWLAAQARQRGLAGAWLPLFLALAWTGTEFVRCEVMPLRFPWLHLGLALEPWPLVSWIGVYGLGFVVAWLLAALVGRRWWQASGLVALTTLAAMLEPMATEGQPLAVTVVQAETAPLETYLEQSRRAPSGTRLIVWPEYAVPKDIQGGASPELAAIGDLATERGALVVFGTQTRLDRVRWQNTALTVNRGYVTGKHVKNHTVHFFDDGERGRTAAALELVIETEGGRAFKGRIGTPICFDCDFHDVVRRMVLYGAQFLAVPSMDAASWSAKQHVLHAQLFRVRAAENRRCMVVAASSGVSQIIDQSGHATASLGAMEQGVLNGTISPSRSLTFFTRLGWLTPWIVLGVLVLWTGWLLAFSPQEKRRSQP